MSEQKQNVAVNFFRPQGAAMTLQTRVVTLLLAGWLIPLAGFQLLVLAAETTGRAELLTRWSLFNLPIHFWLTGQLLPLWFIILCVLFNLWMDRHAARNLDTSLRFRIRNSAAEDE